MILQSQKRNHFNNSNAGNGRLEGLMFGIIEWWVQFHNIDEDLRNTADGVDFSRMGVKSDHEIGEFLLEKNDFWKRFTDDIERNPEMSLLMKIIMTPEADVDDEYLKKYRSSVKQEQAEILEGIEISFRNRLANTLGYRLIANGWWKENEKRIAIERANIKTCSKIHND